MLPNKKHDAFARDIANGATGVQAYRDNVAAPDSKTNTCMTQASILLSDPKIAERIAELRIAANETLEKRLGWTKEKAMAYLVEVLETPVGELDEKHRLANEVTRDELHSGEDKPDVTRVKIKGISKADAMKQLATMCGWNAEEKLELTVSYERPEEAMNRAQERGLDVEAMLKRVMEARKG
jgi:hypothetical protein